MALPLTMVNCDDSLSPSPIMNTSDPEPSTTTMTADDAFWAANQSHGYTPLIENDDEGEPIVFASLEDHHRGLGSQSQEDESDTDEEDDTILQLKTTTKTNEHNNDDDVLLAIADTALSRLELDYERTLSATTVEVSTTTRTEDNNCMSSSLEEQVESETRQPFEFQPDFCSVPPEQFAATAPTPTTISQSQRYIDAEAVRRAVSQLDLPDTFHKHFTEWQAELRRIPPPVPHVHALIPPHVLRSFRNSSTTTLQLTRSASLADACIRLDVLRSTDSCLTIHILGCCAAVEGRYALEQFRPFVKWLGQYVECPTSVRIDLVGPELCERHGGTAGGPVDLLVQAPTTTKPSRLQSAQLYRHGMLYEDFLKSQPSQQQRPHLMVAFHAGIWGYTSWQPCLQAMRRQQLEGSKKIPFVCTAYTVEEAEEDGEVLAEELLECVWSAEPHRFGSHVQRTTVTAPNNTKSRYRENAAWQCWMV